MGGNVVRFGTPQFQGGGGGGPLAGGGGGPHDPGMDARLAHVEARIDRIDSRLDSLDGRLRAIEQSLSGVSAKLDVLGDRVVGKLPSWWQMPAVIGSTIVLLTALWAAIRYLHDQGLL